MERNWKKIIGGVNHSPTMVFSVIEGSESNVYRPWPRSVFKKALIEAVKSGGGMIQYICIHSFLLTFLGNVALFLFNVMGYFELLSVSAKTYFIFRKISPICLVNNIRALLFVCLIVISPVVRLSV